VGIKINIKQMRKLIVLSLVLSGFFLQSEAENTYPQIINIQNRELISLNGLWKTIVDPFENGYYDYRLEPSAKGYFLDNDYSSDRSFLQEYNFSNEKTLYVPGDWNTQLAQLYYYEGTVWYRKHFEHSHKKNKRTFLYFGAVNYEAKVYLNGHKIGEHIGGFTPFNIEVTKLLKCGKNSLVVKVDNKRKADAVPTVNADWWNFGGITRHVYLVETPETFVRDYHIQLDKNNPKELSGWIQLDGTNNSETVKIDIPELKISRTLTTNTSGYAELRIPLKYVNLWSPENPKLYDVSIAVRNEQITDRIGFRSIATKGTDILLNGKKIFLRGICIHEETAVGASRATTEADALTLLTWAKEMGCNFVRLAHYPHNENMIRVAERMGLMVWSEIPVYWTIHWSNPGTYVNAETQLKDMITRDKNRANVIIWSVANETPQSDARLIFLTRLATKARQMDNTRLIAAAMEKEEIRPGVLTVHDPLGDVIDLVSFNQYIGWYDGTWEKCDRVNWEFDIKKPVLISEFGGGALYGNYGPKNQYFTEEYLEELYIRSVDMFKRIPGLAGTTPWLLKDFRSPRRHVPEIQDEFNRKGLVSDKGEKKKAFFVMQKWYNELEKLYK
jgi:beta-glucuronidase